MISLDQFGILGQNLFQPYGSHILMSFPAQVQGIIIFSDRLINCLKLIGISLQFIDIFCCQISGRLKIFADHPFTERRHHLTSLKIYQSQQISGLYIMFIINQALLQTADRT